MSMQRMMVSMYNAMPVSEIFKMTGGTLNVEVGEGDIRPTDSNGDIVSGGTINLTGQSAFDFRWFSDSINKVTLLSMVKTNYWKTHAWWRVLKVAVVPKVVDKLLRRSLKSHRMKQKGSAYGYYCSSYEPDKRMIQVVQDITIKLPVPVLLLLMREWPRRL